MGTSVAQFTGLSSGVQWRDIVDQLVQVEVSRSVTPITSAIETAGKQRTAWSSLQTSVAVFASAAEALRTRSGFASYTAAVPPSATTGRAVASMDVSSGAQPGTYDLEVVSLASARRLGGAAFASASAPLGFSGSFTINDQTVTVASTDSLEGVRDKINALNSGATPTRVSASILATGGGSSRLVLSAGTTGAGGLALGDGTRGVAADLGLATQRSRRVSSATMAVAAALGVTVPPPATIEVNGRTIVVDLATQSLSSIAARIRAAGTEAQVTSETFGGGTGSRLVVGGSVRAVDGDANSAEVVSTLGFAAGDPTEARQQVALAPFTAGGTTNPATASTRLDELWRGSSLGIATGDVLTISGKRGDGTTVSVGLTVESGDTLQKVADRLNAADAFGGAGMRRATAEVGADGALRLLDETGGDSRLSFSLSHGRPNVEATTNLGTAAVEVTGRNRTLNAGSDAQVRVDGVMITRDSNTITDAVPGLSISLKQAEPGTIVQATVRQNVDAQVAAVRALAKAYNDIVTFANQQRASGQPLERNGVLQGAVSSLSTALRAPVSGVGTVDRLAVAGVALDRNGVLQVDEAQLRTALANGTNGALLMDGVGTAAKAAADAITRVSDGTVAIQMSSIDGRMTRLSERQTVAQRRVESLRQRFVDQYTKMESLVSQSQAQGNSVTNSFRAMQSR